MLTFKIRKTSKNVANNVSNFGGDMVTPSQLTAVACYDAGPLKVRLQNVTPATPKPLHIQGYVSRE
jgi:hypothetical protein